MCGKGNTLWFIVFQLFRHTMLPLQLLINFSKSLEISHEEGRDKTESNLLIVCLIEHVDEELSCCSFFLNQNWSYSYMFTRFSPSKPNDFSTSQDFNTFPELSIIAIYVMGYFSLSTLLFHKSTSSHTTTSSNYQCVKLASILLLFSPFVHFLNSPIHASTCKVKIT